MFFLERFVNIGPNQRHLCTCIVNFGAFTDQISCWAIFLVRLKETYADLRLCHFAGCKFLISGTSACISLLITQF